MTRVAIVGGIRTPFVRAGGVYSKYTFIDLAIASVEALVRRFNLDPSQIDELVYSTVLLDPRYPNAAREIVLRSSLPKNLSAHFISNNCISGLVAANFIADGIKSGRIRSGIAGGSESMSRPALTLRRETEDLFIGLSRVRSIGDRLKLLTRFRPSMLVPQPPSPKEPTTGLTMGQHQELTSKEFGISREEQDQIALRSHHNAAKAQLEGMMQQEIEPFGGADKDNLVRADTSIEKLAKLKAVFDRSDKGTLTAGNSSALTDGASAVCLMSEQEAKASGREILAFLEAVEFAAINPSDGLLMAPGVALPNLMHKNKLKIADVDLFEIHEAFASQVACNQLIWEKGWKKYPTIVPIGRIPEERMNLNGGSIALGHPFAATGGRLLTSLANQLKRTGKRTGVISVCAAGAMAAAVLLRRD